MLEKCQKFLFEAPKVKDFWVMALFLIVITWHPFYMQHEIIMMETGIHLPAINAFWEGKALYRDVFFLRGPVEFYIPALMVKMAGMNSAILPLFYYIGSVATMILCAFLALSVFQWRAMYFSFVLILIARTFPRISYYYWGGFRYAMGFITLLGLLAVFKTQKKRWAFLTGIAAAIALLTTLEAGVAVGVGICAAFMMAFVFRVIERKHLLVLFGILCLGAVTVIVPYMVYLAWTGALIPYLQTTIDVVLYNGIAYPGETTTCPANIVEFLCALIPGVKFYKYVSVVWTFIAFALIFTWRVRRKQANWLDIVLWGVLFYGLVLYAASYRHIEGHHFEMALQPQKILYFYVLEWFLLTVIGSKEVLKKLVLIAVIGIVLSTVIFSISRFTHRFPLVKWVQKDIFHSKKVKGLSLLENQEKASLSIARGRGHVVPRWQAQEIEGVVGFLEEHTAPNEPVFCYPEVGNFNFWANRPFVGRFPIGTFTWMYEPWYEELRDDFKKAMPHYVVMTHVGHRTFPATWYFRNPDNKRRFDEMTQLILNNYRLVKSFEAVGIYERTTGLGATQ